MKKGYMVVLLGEQNEKGRKFFEEKPSEEVINELIKSQIGVSTAVITECEYIQKQ
ncbi:hypothetical protein [Niallia taxi]|uniref:hypothetical protein n=1 Tax=Niallia taxi TaxID=2499688 RepID=UPI00254CEB3B|nr:hypothetical protein [Niallia taxi]MDK8641338.1 hypothetical protein [Niallia taxi]